MKYSRILALLSFISIVVLLPFTAQAQSCTSAAPFCDNPNYVCQIEPGENMGFCTPPSAVDDGPGTGEVGNCGGLACSSTEVCCEANGQQFCATQTQCDAQDGGNSSIPNSPTTQATESNNQTIRPFEPLTSVPGLREAAQSNNFAGLLNNLYLICVGAGAALAVLQIVRGGLTYMLSDSVTNKKEAREVITGAVVGLLLVLSPAIVFGIIDPRILNLNVNFGPLKPADSAGQPGDRGGESLMPGDEQGQTGAENDQENDSEGGSSGDDTNQTGTGGSVPIRACVTVGSYVGISYNRSAEFCVVGGMTTSSGVPITLCEGKPTLTVARRNECNLQYPGPYDPDCAAARVECTNIRTSFETTSAQACRNELGPGGTIIANCSQATASGPFNESVPAPLCSLSAQYGLNSQNLDCPS